MVNKEQAARLRAGMAPQLDEKQRRLYAGTLADTYRNPKKVLSWTTESLRKIKTELAEGHNTIYK
jgi:hypothetical protein